LKKCVSTNKRHVIQHNYPDHSDESDNLDSSPKQEPELGLLVQFPRKLHELLETIEADGLADVISWQPHGRAFLIHKTVKFSVMVMP
jgi:hypothetical protein